jgi:Asp-tRNA(Asn)/Glu-tRNA(Gln) amidotransferase A subunit family amidase
MKYLIFHVPSSQILQDVDVLITPTTPVTAPVIPPSATTKGNSDISQARAEQKMEAWTTMHIGTLIAVSAEQIILFLLILFLLSRA